MATFKILLDDEKKNFYFLIKFIHYKSKKIYLYESKEKKFLAFVDPDKKFGPFSSEACAFEEGKRQINSDQECRI